MRRIAYERALAKLVGFKDANHGTSGLFGDLTVSLLLSVITVSTFNRFNSIELVEQYRIAGTTFRAFGASHETFLNFSHLSYTSDPVSGRYFAINLAFGVNQ